MSIVTQLAGSLSARWRQAQFHISAFPELASQALREFAPHERVMDVVSHLCSDQEGTWLPDHANRDIAPLHINAHFGIYLHAWVDGFAPPHHHDWAGAYQVLAGDSVDALYRYNAREQVQQHFSLGELLVLRVDNMRPGDIREVEPGPAFIHGLSYNTKASLSLSIRSWARTGHVCMDYLHAGVAFETDKVPGYVKSRQKALRALYYIDRKTFDGELAAWITQADLLEAFYALQLARELSPELLGMNTSIEAGTRKHGQRFAAIVDASAEKSRCDAHANARRLLPDDDREFRTFLGATFTCRTRDSIVDALTAVGMDANPDALYRFARRTLESSGHQFDSWGTGLESLLRHALRAVSLAEVLEALRNDFDDGVSADGIRAATEIHAALRRHPILGALFSLEPKTEDMYEENPKTGRASQDVLALPRRYSKVS